MKRTVFIFGVLIAAGVAVAAPALADQCPDQQLSEEECVVGTAGGFEASDVEVPAGTVPQGERESAAGGAGTKVKEYRYVPTCTGNAPDDNRLVCTLSLETCPEPGEVRFWVYTRNRDTSTGAVTEWQRRTQPPSVCLRPDDPVLDPTVAIPAMIESEFKRVVVLKGVADVSPKPDTLVNIPTRFRTAAPASYDIPLTLLGQSVVITATAERFTWHFGDGATARTAAAGGAIEHEYTAAETRQAHVVIEWSGTYRINGGPPRPIVGTATTTGEPVQVQVRQARTELVRD